MLCRCVKYVSTLCDAIRIYSVKLTRTLCFEDNSRSISISGKSMEYFTQLDGYAVYNHHASYRMYL